MAFDKEVDFEQARVLHNNWQCQLFELDVGFADLYLSALADML
jgi:hypothetical protein